MKRLMMSLLSMLSVSSFSLMAQESQFDFTFNDSPGSTSNNFVPTEQEGVRCTYLIKKHKLHRVYAASAPVKNSGIGKVCAPYEYAVALFAIDFYTQGVLRYSLYSPRLDLGCFSTFEEAEDEGVRLHKIATLNEVCK